MDDRIADLKAALAVADARYEGLRVMYDTLADRYHQLALRTWPPNVLTQTGTNGAVAPVEVEVEGPPEVVLLAMRAISPTRDKTYDANWAFWERNKERAAAHPEAFAEEILAGVEPGNAS